MTKPPLLTPEMLLSAYQQGIFPMADSRTARDVAWYAPHMRGILPIDGLHVPKRLQKTIRQNHYDVFFDCQFKDVVKMCADMRAETWINDDIILAYTALHHQGFAHSAEVVNRETGQLIGGVYGVAIGGVFFGESMFSVETDASKIALVHLVARLWERGYVLFDTQMINDHLKQFGCYELPHEEFLVLLKEGLERSASFYSSDVSVLPDVLSGSVGECVSSAGECSGVASDEKVSDLAAVDLFLQAMTQTS